uniref:Uncharacterized protein n=1 Tax=Palpitomonas bilix TaxID=652834 RepID=A0A7S3DL99_9EUKA|mmetsp:Transcript_4299/g.8626  ORF Transcript_4299/g.8626 Transcript_4299/m.8626 type:complete len:105 (+) Transcript_4299:129-443(+)
MYVGFADDSNVSATDVISVVIAVVMIIYSAFRMGRRRGEEPEAVAGDRGDIELQKDEKEDDEEDVDDEKEGLTYNPTFFHLVLATVCYQLQHFPHCVCHCCTFC